VFVHAQPASTDFLDKRFTDIRSVGLLQEYKAIHKKDSIVSQWTQVQELTYLRKGFEASTTLDAKPESIYFSKKLGNLYNSLDSFTQAIHYIKYPIRLNYDTISVARSYNRLGYLYFALGDYNTALEQFFTAVRYGKLMGKGWETYPLGNIASVYKHLEDYDNAIRYIKEAIPLDQQLPSPKREYGLTYSYTYLMDFYRKLNRIDSALQYIDLIENDIAVIDTFDLSNYRDLICYAHIKIAEVYIQAGNLPKAKGYIDRAKIDQTDDRLRNILPVEGKYWLAKGDYDQAKSILVQYDTLDLQNLNNEQSRLNLKIEYYTAINDLEEVVDLQKELLSIQKEKFGDDRLRFSSIANAEYKALEQQQKIDRLENQQKIAQLQSRNQWIILGFVFLLCFGLALFFRHQSRQRKRLSEYLDKQVRLKTKDLEQANFELVTFNYIASHDIKEPIRVIGGYVGLIRKRLPDDLKEELGEYFQTIQKSMGQLYNLVEDFARYSKLSREELQNSNMVELNELLLHVQDIFEEHTDLREGQLVMSELPAIPTSPTFLFPALKNLIENGLKFNESECPVVNVSYQKTTTQHEIIISDNGIGIDPKYHDQIFEMFTRLHQRGEYKGSGIGLAIVKLCLKKLGGNIRLESHPEQGTRFVVGLPFSAS